MAPLHALKRINPYLLTFSKYLEKGTRLPNAKYMPKILLAIFRRKSYAKNEEYCPFDFVDVIRNSSIAH